jgi:DNA polymerase III epsilon subunit-like protein
MSSQTQDGPASVSLSKKERGRLKKLRKRALELRQGSALSGLCLFADFEEYNRLRAGTNNNEPVIGPCVIPRKPKDDWQRADAEDHRDLLWHLMFQYNNNSSHKRSRSGPSVPAVPPWATLHNPSAIQSVAVIEIHIEALQKDASEIEHGQSWWQEQILPRLPILSNNDKQVLPVWTRWFQGEKVKSPSDSIMYLPRNDSTNEKIGAGELADALSVDDLTKRLKSLVLSASKRQSEGYPMRACDNATVENSMSSLENVLLPTEISSEEASAIVRRCRVSVSILGEDDPKRLNGFVETKKVCSSGSLPRVFALDCEMVKTTAGSELARMTLVQLTNVGTTSGDEIVYKLVMDELVKPCHPVVDYLTEYSGITAAKLKSVTTSLEQVQASFISCVHASDILVAHSGENDLIALRVIHDTVVDTSILFCARGGRKYCKSASALFCVTMSPRRSFSINLICLYFIALRHLSMTLLGKRIQESSGHCSEEDASAALELAVQRARVGSSFRIRERSDDRWHLLQEIKEGQLVAIGPAEWLRTHIITNKTSTAHALTCETLHDTNLKALTSWLSSPKRRAKFVWANLAVPAESRVPSLDLANQTMVSLCRRSFHYDEILRRTTLIFFSLIYFELCYPALRCSWFCRTAIGELRTRLQSEKLSWIHDHLHSGQQTTNRNF